MASTQADRGADEGGVAWFGVWADMVLVGWVWREMVTGRFCASSGVPPDGHAKTRLAAGLCNRHMPSAADSRDRIGGSNPTK